MSVKDVELRSTVAGVTAEGQLHTLSVWFILALRLMMGLAFLEAGLDKLLGGGFSAAGYLSICTGGPIGYGPFHLRLTDKRRSHRPIPHPTGWVYTSRRAVSEHNYRPGLTV
jgi:hypothetical protein